MPVSNSTKAFTAVTAQYATPESNSAPVTWMTIPEVCAILRMGKRATCNAITKSGRLKASWVGRRWLISSRNLELYIRSMEQDFSESK